jgi:hypothetical protein
VGDGDAGLIEMGDFGLVVDEEPEDRGDGGSNQVPKMRDRAWSFERRIGSIDACHFLKLDLPSRVGMVHWEMWENSRSVSEDSVDVGEVGEGSGAV